MSFSKRYFYKSSKYPEKNEFFDVKSNMLCALFRSIMEGIFSFPNFTSLASVFINFLHF